MTRPIPAAHPATDAITIGVYGGVVQWVRGNAVPVRIVDYDGEHGDKLDRDENGEPCTIWDVPARADLKPQAR